MSSEDLVRERSRRHEIIAELSKKALAETDLEDLTDLAVRQVARLIDVDLVELHELRKDGDNLVPCAGFGWNEGYFDAIAGRVDADSPAGLALLSNRLVVVENLESDERFSDTELLQEHDVTSGVCLILHGDDQPYGVLGIYSRRERRFDYDEIYFLQSAANVIGTAIARFRTREMSRMLAQRRREMNEELEAEIERRTRQVRMLASELTLTEQRERQRIARVLHDDVQQLLYGAQLQLHMGAKSVRDNDEARKKLTAVDELLLEAIDTTRTLTVGLSPPILKGEGLAQALHWLAAQERYLHDLDVSIEDAGWTELPEEQIRLLVFQFIRELLFNVVKHAGVRSARVILKSEEGLYRIRVEDDGNGYEIDDPETGKSVPAGFGLSRIRDRLHLFGGQLHIESAPGSGTRVEIVLPTNIDEGFGSDKQ